MRHRLLTGLLLFLASAGATRALAQGGAGSTGVIQGVVTDDSGGLLPGVVVTATSDAMMGSRTDITTAQGAYRFLGLPAGAYSVTFTLPGFGAVTTPGVRIGIGFTASVNAKLKVQSLSEEVEVVGGAPAIDTTATRVQTNYNKDQLDSLPNARDMWSLLSTTPSISLNRFDVGGSTAGTQTTYAAFGNGGQNRPLVEGINTTEGTSAAGFYLDLGSFEEVFIGAAGNTSEMPSSGVLTQFIGKSGSNKLGGELYYEKEWEGLQSTNITADQLSRGAANLGARAIQQLGLNRGDGNTLLDYRNLNASVGGPIIKDKLWVWGGILRQENAVYQPAAGAILDGTQFGTKLRNYTGKITYQLTPRDKFIAYTQYGVKQQPNRTDAEVAPGPQHLTAGSTLLQDSPSWVGKIEYNRTLGSRSFLEIRAGEFGYNFALKSNEDGPRREDTTTGEVTGNGRDWRLDRRRKQLTGAYTLFFDNVLGASHQMKVGAEVQHETGRTRWNKFYTDNLVHVFVNNVASRIIQGAEVDARNGLRNYGVFVTDTLTRNRLTLNVGARFDRYRVFLPAQERPASRFAPAASFAAVNEVKAFNHVAPRVGVVYDLSGTGNTVLKANFGRFYFNTGVGFADSVNPNTATQQRTYTWTDRNGDRLWQSGEEVALQTDTIGLPGTFDPNNFFDPNLKNSHTDEVSFWVERELPGKIGARVGYVRKMDRDGYQRENVNRLRSNYTTPAFITDIGRDGVSGSDDVRIPVLAYTGALPATRNLVVNPDGYIANYDTVEIGANKRFSGKFSLSTSFSLTNTNEWATSYFGGGGWGTNVGAANGSLFSSFGGGNFPTTPNDQGELTDFWTYNFKLNGTAELLGIRWTPVFKMQQGFPYARGVNGTLNYGAQSVEAEPLGSFRMKTVTQLDVRADKRFKLNKRYTLSVMVDVFNAFNANTELNIRHTTGQIVISETGARVPSFQSPLTILPPRIARLSARLSF